MSVATPVVVEGPLAAPGFRVEEGGLLGTLTELVTKISIPSLILVDAFGDAVKESPCAVMLSGGPSRSSTTSGAVRGVGKGAGSLVRGSAGFLQGLLGGGAPAEERPAQGKDRADRPLHPKD